MKLLLKNTLKIVSLAAFMLGCRPQHVQHPASHAHISKKKVLTHRRSIKRKRPSHTKTAKSWPRIYSCPPAISMEQLSWPEIEPVSEARLVDEERHAKRTRYAGDKNNREVELGIEQSEEFATNQQNLQQKRPEEWELLRDRELIKAAKAGNTERVRTLLKKGADKEMEDDEGSDDDAGLRALHYACAEGHPNTVQLLLEAKVDVNVKTKLKERTPLHYACMSGKLEIVKALKEYNAKTEARDTNGGTPILYAAGEGHAEIVRFFVEEESIDKNHFVDKNGTTILHAAAAGGNRKLVEYTLKHLNQNLNAEDRHKMTPLHYAAIADDKEVADYLVEKLSKSKKSSIDLADTNGNTALHHAVYEESEGIVQLLLENGASSSLKNKDKLTPKALANQLYGAEHSITKLFKTATEQRGQHSMERRSQKKASKG